MSATATINAPRPRGVPASLARRPAPAAVVSSAGARRRVVAAGSARRCSPISEAMNATPTPASTTWPASVPNGAK